MIPTTLDEAVDQIIASMSEAAKAGWRASKDGYAARLHRGFGTALRNDWGLWYNKTPIARWFQSYGVLHADDRSGIILDAVHARLKGLPFSIDEQAVYYKAWWAKRGMNADGSPRTAVRRLFVKKDGSVTEDPS
jgi:hypothetical protein